MSFAAAPVSPAAADEVPLGHSRAQSADWDAAIAALASPGPLLQSWAWGEAHRRLGWRPERVQLPGGGRALVLVRRLGPFAWAYAPRGPVPATIDAVLELVEWARSRQFVMLRVEPEGPVELRNELGTAGFKPGRSIEPRHTAIVPLADPGVMLASFRRTTRYNIRLAERHGVTVEEVPDTAELTRQIDATATRHRVWMEGPVYHRTLATSLPDVHLYVARYKGEALAANLVVRHDRRSYYLLAGSSGARRELKPNYALAWRAILDAREAGCLDHDLYGMPPPDEPTHPWHGLSEFKTGFAGSPVEYTGTWDLALKAGGHTALVSLQTASTRAARLSLRARLALGGLGQSRERLGTFKPPATPEPMDEAPGPGLNG